MIHRHHIMPKYRGGTDDEANLIDVTPTQHAMYHFANWQLWKDHRDFCAWKMITRDVKSPEFRSARAKAFAHVRVEAARKAGVYSTENARKRGKVGNNKQREKFAAQGRTIAEKRWLVTNPDGEQFEINNMAKFCRENNLDKGKMTLVAKDERKHHKGWRCKKL